MSIPSLGTYVFVLQFVRLFGVINPGPADREPWEGHRIPSSPDGYSVFTLGSWCTSLQKAACFSALLYIPWGSVCLLGCSAWSFLSITMSSFWPINGGPPEAGKEGWQLQPRALCCCCLVAKPCWTLCNRMDCSMPGFPVLHHLPEFVQTQGPCYAFEEHSSFPLANLSLCTLWLWSLCLTRFSVSVDNFSKINSIRVPLSALGLEIHSHHISHRALLVNGPGMIWLPWVIRGR